MGRSLERELDDIVPVLLKKAGELSTAGTAARALAFTFWYGARPTVSVPAVSLVVRLLFAHVGCELAPATQHEAQLGLICLNMR